MLSYISDKKVIQMKNILLLFFGTIMIIFTGCDYFENGETLDSGTIEINISGLPAIADSMTYVAWVENEDPEQLGRTIIVASDAVDGNFNFKSEKPFRVLQASMIFWLSIEHESIVDDSVFVPSNRRILSGRFTRGGSILGLGESVINFNNTSAVFRLLTPTDGAGTNETSGIWFVDVDSVSQLKAGLDLPELYQGWIYEGWIEVDSTFLSTGRFRNPAASDLRKEFGGADDGLPFPGEDFLTNAPGGLTFPLDLAGKQAYVSLELNDGRTAGETPGYIIYQFTIPTPAQSAVTYEMVNANPDIPAGDAVINVDFVK